MFWSTLFLAIPALALAAAVWGVLRRKWYGVLPLLIVAAVGWMWDEIWWWGANDFFEACANQSAVNQVMALLLVDGAAIMSLVALWAGWSRGWWFWRALLLAAVLASAAPLEANELILICLIAMPPLALTAWLIRWRRDRAARHEEAGPRARQVSLANLFLAFVVFGLLATAVRSLLVGHLTLADPSLFWLAGSIAAMAIAAFLPTVTRGSGRKWLVGGPAAFLMAWIAGKWWNWNGDPLGLASYLRRSRFPSMIDVYQLEGEIFFLIIVGLGCCIYAAAEHYKTRVSKVRLVRAALVLAILALLVPLVVIYPMMLPPHSAVTPLPPNEPYETIMRAGLRIRRLESENANRGKFLAALLELDQALPQPGHVTHDAMLLARESLASNRAMDPKQSLARELHTEISRALYEGRDPDALRLVRLLRRVGETYYRGGTLHDYYYGEGSNSLANWTIIALASSVSELDRRELLQETQALEQTEPDGQAVVDFDVYWQNVSVGWRDRLHTAAAWLAGEKNHDRQKPTAAGLEAVRLRVRATTGIAQYVLALEIYRREHGEFPQELSAVQTAFKLPELTDPYTENAPIYRRTADSYLLYSVGRDGQDDGGNFPAAESGPIPISDNQDVNLVMSREDLTYQWKMYLKYSPAPLSPSPPVPKAAPTEQE